MGSQTIQFQISDREHSKSLSFMINTNLFQKYDTKFNFFFAKPITQIIFNQTTSSSTLAFKDVIVLAETSQYLKRVYRVKNAVGRNQIYDRIKMLADFYEGAIMAKYEHPMMIITKTKDIFLKRIKRMKNMIASDCSSQESSQRSSQKSSFKSFESSKFLRTLRDSQIEDSQFESRHEHSQNRSERSFDSQVHDVYEQDFSIKGQLGLLQSFKKMKIELNCSNRENGDYLNHLIIDIGDIDKQKFKKEYQALSKQNRLQQIIKPKSSKKSAIVIKALDHNPLLNQSSESSRIYHNYYPVNIKQTKKPSSSHRYKEQYDETVRLGGYGNNFIERNEGNIEIGRIRQVGSLRSPSFGPPENNETERTRNVHIQPSRQEDQRRFQQQYRQPRERGFMNSYQNSNLNPHLFRENDQGYHPHESRVSQISSKHYKKQIIREKAVALLHKVKSEQKLSVFYEQTGPRFYRYQNRARLTDFE